MKHIFIKLSIIALVSTSLFANISEMVFKGIVELAIPFLMDGVLKSDSQKKIDKTNTSNSMENFKRLFTIEETPKEETQPIHKTNIQEDDPCIF